MASKKKYRRPTHAVVTLPDPDHMDTASYVEVGGRIEWRCETPDYPLFEIVFLLTNPFNKQKDYVLKGTIHKPVVRVAKVEGNHEYHVKHLPPKEAPAGAPTKQSGPFNAQIGTGPGIGPHH